MPVYLTLQPIRSAARNVAIAPGGLLPRLFILTATRAAVIFCHFTPTFRPAPRGEYGALCCPDFPLDLYRKVKRRTPIPDTDLFYEKYPLSMPRLALRMN